ncbi:hypothetical protein ACEXQD_06005 [Herbiconiux sp. P15]|uniref:hypothetical protein n=1 Tax=Herbiconiux liukaitaii TaxID=3342799 RepID=UPI0035B8A660
MTAVLPSRPDTAILRWASPETRLWVATHDGEYAGMVEFTDGHFVTHDRAGRTVGTSSSLPAAQRAILHPVAAPISLPYVAAVAGTVALSLSTMGIAALAA